MLQITLVGGGQFELWAESRVYSDPQAHVISYGLQWSIDFWVVYEDSVVKLNTSSMLAFCVLCAWVPGEALLHRT